MSEFRVTLAAYGPGFLAVVYLSSVQVVYERFGAKKVVALFQRMRLGRVIDESCTPRTRYLASGVVLTTRAMCPARVSVGG
jgi:hypothetical protein